MESYVCKGLQLFFNGLSSSVARKKNRGFGRSEECESWSPALARCVNALKLRWLILVTTSPLRGFSAWKVSIAVIQRWEIPFRGSQAAGSRRLSLGVSGDLGKHSSTCLRDPTPHRPVSVCNSWCLHQEQCVILWVTCCVLLGSLGERELVELEQNSVQYVFLDCEPKSQIG